MGRLSDCLLSGLAVGSVEWFACLLSRGSSVFVFFSLFILLLVSWFVCLPSGSSPCSMKWFFFSCSFSFFVSLWFVLFVYLFFSIKLSYSVHVLVSRASLTP